MLSATAYLYNTESYAFDVVAAMHGTTAAVLRVLFVIATNCVSARMLVGVLCGRAQQFFNRGAWGKKRERKRNFQGLRRHF